MKPIICDSENCTSQCAYRGKGKECPYLMDVKQQRRELEFIINKAIENGLVECL